MVYGLHRDNSCCAHRCCCHCWLHTPRHREASLATTTQSARGASDAAQTQQTPKLAVETIAADVLFLLVLVLLLLMLRFERAVVVGFMIMLDCDALACFAQVSTHTRGLLAL